jgi:autotransporter-associated beta strand protein
VVQAAHDHAFGSGTLNIGGGTLSSDSTAARTFAHPTIISGPAVVLGNATNHGKLVFQGTTSTGTANRTITANSEVEFRALRTGGQVTKAGTGKLVLSGSLTATTASAVLAGESVTLGAAGATLDTNGFDIEIPVSFEGPGGLTKSGSGTLSLSGRSSFTGPLTVAAGSLRLLPSTVLPAGLKILPIGDSITFGYGGRDGYRSYLYTKLARIAPGFRFLGDSTEIPLNPSNLPAEHLFHAGHSSYSTTDIQNNLDGFDSATFQLYGGAERNPNGGYWLSGGHGTGRTAIFPDAILLLAGTNDIDRLEMAGAQTRYRALLTKMTTLRPDARVFAAKVTPWAANASKVTQLNQVISGLVTEFKNAGKKVRLVDLHTGYTGGFVDGVHPAEAGYQWMADRWHAALLSSFGTAAVPDLGQASSVTVMPGAVLEGTGKLATTNLSGTLRNGITAAGADLLEIAGDLNLDQATLAITSPAQPVQSSYEILRYTGNLSGGFDTVVGLPEGFHVVHRTDAKKIYLATAYEEWRLKSGIGDTAKSPEADPDQDGRSNLLEYAFGGKPLDPADRGTLIENLDGSGEGKVLGLLIATHTGASFAAGPDHGLVASVGGTTYQVEASSDLGDWSLPVSELVPVPAGLPPAPEGYEYHAFTTSAPDRAFARVKLSQLP